MEFGMQFRRADAKDKIGQKCWHAVECAPLDGVKQLQEKKLVEQMVWLKKHSTFYQRKFSDAGLSFDEIKSIDDLQKVPYTVKTELRDSLAAERPFGQHLAADLADVIQMQASSGTTGSPAYIALTESDAEQWHEMSARCFFSGGINPGDLVLHGFSLAKGFVGGVPIVQALQYMGAIDIPIGADGGPDRLLRVAADLRPRCIVGAPNFILHLAERAPELIGMEAKDLGVERVIVGGEPGGGIPAIRARIEELWGAKCCELLGGTDFGVTYWAECNEQSGMHMVSPDYIIVELLDTNTDEIIPFETGVSGELIYTALGRKASPLVRFRSGDHVEVLGTDCGCGRTGPKIRCVGRTDDMLIVRGANVFPSAIQSIIADMQPRTNGVMRVFADFVGHTTQGALKIYVERGPHASKNDDGALKSDIKTKLRNSLVFKADVQIVDYEIFEKPGVKKVSLTLRSTSELPWQ